MSLSWRHYQWLSLTLKNFISKVGLQRHIDTVRPSQTSRNLQRGTKQFTPMSHNAVAECIHWLGLVPILLYFHGLGTCYMLTIIYIYFNFTIINFTYRLNCTFHSNASCRRDGLGLVMNALSWVIGKMLGRVRTSDKASALRVWTERVDWRQFNVVYIRYKVSGVKCYVGAGCERPIQPAVWLCAPLPLHHFLPRPLHAPLRSTPLHPISAPLRSHALMV